MSLIGNATSENSVTFSLAELAKLEEERLRTEVAQRARALDEETRARREADARRRAAEAELFASEVEARAKRSREEAEEKARIEARREAEIHVARIQAEAKARIDAENAERAHELAVIRARAESGRGRLQVALAAALGIALCVGAAGAYKASQRVASLEQDAERLRDAQSTLVRERERAKETELAALDRRFTSLRAHPFLRQAEDTRATAEAARSAVDTKALDHDRLRAFGDALDVLEARLDALGRIAVLDKRRADLVAWAAERRQSDATASVQSAAERARAASPDDTTIRAYEAALDRARDALARPSAARGPSPSPGVTTRQCAYEGDPLCGLNGQSL